MPAPFGITASLIGASPQRLSEWLTTNGYTDSMALVELTINNLAGATTLYRGGAAVDATIGYPIEGGGADTQRASGVKDNFIDATQVYLFVAITRDITVSVVGR